MYVQEPVQEDSSLPASKPDLITLFQPPLYFPSELSVSEQPKKKDTKRTHGDQDKVRIQPVKLISFFVKLNLS